MSNGIGGLLVLGSPLLDVSAIVDEETLSKYHLLLDGFTLEGDKQKGYIEYILSRHDAHYTPGGSGLNTIRVYTALHKSTLNECKENNILNKSISLFQGTIGADSNGELLRKLCNEEGVLCNWLVSDELSTGVCGVGINNTNRSLCTRLGASGHYHCDNIKDLKNYNIFYVTGYFLNVSIESAIHVAQIFADENKLVAINCSAEFIILYHFNNFLKMLPYADIILGNKEEWLAVGKMLNVEHEEDLIYIGKYISLSEKKNDKRKRIIVITRGSDDTLVITGDTHKYIPVPHINEDKIIDTNAAGDAMSGGFLYGYEKSNGDVDIAVAYGHSSACQIIQVYGATCANLKSCII